MWGRIEDVDETSPDSPMCDTMWLSKNVRNSSISHDSWRMFTKMKRKITSVVLLENKKVGVFWEYFYFDQKMAVVSIMSPCSDKSRWFSFYTFLVRVPFLFVESKILLASWLLVWLLLLLSLFSQCLLFIPFSFTSARLHLSMSQVVTSRLSWLVENPFISRFWIPCSIVRQSASQTGQRQFSRYFWQFATFLYFCIAIILVFVVMQRILIWMHSVEANRINKKSQFRMGSFLLIGFQNKSFDI